MRSITLGQYYPARSLIHSLDPRTKVILAMLYIVCSFVCKSVASFGLLLVSAIVIEGCYALADKGADYI